MIRAAALKASFSVFTSEVKVQMRSGLYAAYAVMTLLFLLVLFLIPQEYRMAGFGLIILMDPSLMGFFFAGGLVLFEAEQGVLPVFLTRGRGFTSYWRGKAAAILSLAAAVVTLLTAAAWAVGLIEPNSKALVLTAAGLLLTVPLFMSFGLMLAGRVQNVVEYFLAASVISLPLMIPLIELFGISTGWFGVLSPVWGSMVLITSVYHETAFGVSRTGAEIGTALLMLFLWNWAAYVGAGRSFSRLAAGQGKTKHSAGSSAGAAGRLSFESADLRLLIRDPVTILLLAAPLLISVVLGRIIPWMAGPESPFSAVVPASGAALVLKGMDVLRSFALLLSPLMYGMIGALLFLDEKDAGVLPFLRTVPGPNGWFIMRRCRMLMMLYFLVMIPSVLLGGLMHGNVLVCIISLAVDALALPMIFLLMGILAQNKVQGLSFAKALNILCLPPVIIALLPGNWVWLAGLFPTGWGSLLRLEATGIGQVFTASAVGFLYSGAIAAYLFRKALRISLW